MPLTRWTRPGAALMLCALILTSLSGCAAGSAAPTSPSLNPFCSLVGPPPPEMLPEPGAPFGWIDRFLAVYDETC